MRIWTLRELGQRGWRGPSKYFMTGLEVVLGLKDRKETEDGLLDLRPVCPVGF